MTPGRRSRARLLKTESRSAVGPSTGWCEQGHVGLERIAKENLLLPVDLVHEPTGTVIAVDESDHFTSFRLTALDLYRADVPVAFDLCGTGTGYAYPSCRSQSWTS